MFVGEVNTCMYVESFLDRYLRLGYPRRCCLYTCLANVLFFYVMTVSLLRLYEERRTDLVLSKGEKVASDL